jgi:IS5 family transposase
VSMIRRVRRAIDVAAAVAVSAHDYDADGKPACAWDDLAARDALVSALVNDALDVLVALEGIELDEDQQQLVGLLGLVAGQDVEQGDTPGSWRIATRVAKDRVISTVDPETRHMHKSRSHYRDGFKAHLAVEPETGLITAVELTPANTSDSTIGVGLLAGEVCGVTVIADAAYGTGPMRAALADADHVAVIKPWPLQPNERLGADQFDRDDFTVDYAAATVTCPNGVTVTIAERGAASFRSHCRNCVLRSRCTTNRNGRVFYVSEHDQFLATARAEWRSGVGADDYRQWRPMVERSIAWLVANGQRRVRYRGVARNRIGLHLRAAAINLRRLVNLGLTHTDIGWAIVS